MLARFLKDCGGGGAGAVFNRRSADEVQQHQGCPASLSTPSRSNTAGDPTCKLLQQCASDSSKFFLLTSANEIVTTFNTIGTNPAQLRIT